MLLYRSDLNCVWPFDITLSPLLLIAWLPVSMALLCKKLFISLIKLAKCCGTGGNPCCAACLGQILSGQTCTIYVSMLMQDCSLVLVA